MATSSVSYKVSSFGRHKYWHYNSLGSLIATGEVSSGSSVPADGGSLIRTRISHRGWKREIQLVSQATNPYERTETTISTLQGRAESKVKYHTGLFAITQSSGHLGSTSLLQPPTLIDLSPLLSEAKIGFVRKVRKSSTGFQTGVFLGELRETIKLVTHPVDSFRRALDDYRAATKKVIAGSTTSAVGRNLGNLYLEHSFGWRPIFSDIDSGMKALAGLKPVYSDPIGFSASKDYRGSPFAILTRPSGINQWWVRVTGQPRFDGKVRYKGVVAWESQNLAGGWRRDWGLTLDQFVPTIYELIPHSWLVDYFTNLGAIIDTISLGTIGLRWGSLSQLGYSFNDYTFCGLVPDSGLSAVSNTVTGSVRVTPDPTHRFTFLRSKVDKVAVSLSDFQLQLPGFAGQWSILGALALARSGRR